MIYYNHRRGEAIDFLKKVIEKEKEHGPRGLDKQPTRKVLAAFMFGGSFMSSFFM